MKFYEPQKHKIFTFWWGWGGVLFPAFSFQMFSQSSSDVQSVFFKCAINPLQISTSASLIFYYCFYDDLFLLLWWFTPAFRMIYSYFLMSYSYFYDEVAEYRLNPHGYCLGFVSDVDCNSFLPRIQNFQAEKIIVSCRENFMLNTRIHFILYENEVHSSKEWSVFS